MSGAAPAPRGRDELEFLPAALEVVRTPASPAGRAVLWTLIALCLAAGAWTWIGEVDVVATARGRVIPSARVKVVQPAEMGVIRTIHVRDGDTVRAGDVLVELDPTSSHADAARLDAERATALLERDRIRRFLEHLDDDRTAVAGIVPAAFRPDAGGQADSALNHSLLEAQKAEYRSRLAAIDDEQRMREAQLATIGANVRRLERTLPLVAQRAEALRDLAERQLAARADYLEIEQAHIEQQGELEAQRSRGDEIEAALASVHERRRTTAAEFRRSRLEALTEVERRLAALDQELVKAARRTRLQTIAAPADGVVQQLRIHTTGGVVTPAQELLRIVPAGDRLEVEAWVENKDIGFVRAGQEVEVKFDAFPFTRYGTIPARVVDLSTDAATDETHGLAYRARVALARTDIDVDGVTVPLASGMAATVEVKIGTRRIIEFLLSPVLRGLKESGRER